MLSNCIITLYHTNTRIRFSNKSLLELGTLAGLPVVQFTGIHPPPPPLTPIKRPTTS